MDAQDRLEQQAKLDVEEIQEWVDALDGVLKRDGVAGATQLLRTLSAELTKTGASLPYTVSTPYRNTIPSFFYILHLYQTLISLLFLYPF